MTHEDVHDRASFVAYIGALRAELVSGGSTDAWASTDLPSFFEAMEAWAKDWNEPAQTNPWRHAADVITAATVYE
jgi:hypothetical protein